MIKEKGKQARLAGRPLGSARHICAFFRSTAEKYDVLGSFIMEGFAQDDKAVHVIDPARKIEHCRCLENLGIELSEALHSGKLDLMGWDDAHVRHGRFDQKEMLARMEDMFRRNAALGFGMTRYIADMEWSQAAVPGARGLIEFEARLNYLIPKYRDTVVCTYDLARFNATTVMDILRTHPMAIIGGILQENPFFVSPEEFLEEPPEA
ncbi:MAG: sensory transduction histidine kinase [Fibrobacteres bacterium]|nr:sensory transduction histidine kinase [Fibrobacterota bacterium]